MLITHTLLCGGGSASGNKSCIFAWLSFPLSLPGWLLGAGNEEQT